MSLKAGRKATRGRPRGIGAARTRETAGRAEAGVRSPEDVLTWAEVSRTHRIQNGVYQREGRLVSLLTDFGRLNPCYPDARDADDADTITYTGAGRHGDQHLSPANRALLSAIETGHAVPLFNKLGVGRWQHTGFWRVTPRRARQHRGR